MGDYIDILGHPTWVETGASRATDAETVLLLHGGLSNSDALLDTIGGVSPTRIGWLRSIAVDMAVPAIRRRRSTTTTWRRDGVRVGAGRRRPCPSGRLERRRYIAMLVALSHPDLVRRLVLIGANSISMAAADGPPTRLARRRNDALVYAERSPDGGDPFGEGRRAFTMFATEPTMTTEAGPGSRRRRSWSWVTMT